MRRANAMNCAGLELLVAEEDHAVLEKRGPNVLGGDVFREINPEDLGAERASDSPYFYCSTLMFWLLMIEP